jgi:ubiquinone/menaquinone biosynthesis C-methylase UbiE
MKISFEFVKNSFNNNVIVSNYYKAIDEIGLWCSEGLVLKKYFNPNNKILVIGCGAGRVPFGLYDMGYRGIYGLDISESMIHKAIETKRNKNFVIDFQIGNALFLPYNSSIFDGVFMPYNVLMHIPSITNRLLALSEIKRVLVKNSFFIFTTHNDRNSSPQWKEYWDTENEKWLKGLQDDRLFELGDRIVSDKGSEIFMHFPTNEEVIKTINESGFSIVETKLRSEICDEPKNVLDFSLDCRFWVIAPT